MMTTNVWKYQHNQFYNRGTHTELRITQFVNTCTCSLLKKKNLHYDTL